MVGLYISFGSLLSLKKNFRYCKVASSRPVYYSILDPLGQRSQYISIKFHENVQDFMVSIVFFKM